MFKASNIFAFAAMAITWGIMTLFGYWAFLDRATPVTVSFDGANKTVVFHDEEVVLEYTVASHRNCDVVSRRYMKNRNVAGNIYFISISERRGDIKSLGRESKVIVKFKIPLEMPAGEYDFYIKSEYECNPFQKLSPIVLYTPHVTLEVRDIGLLPKILNSK